jgi:ComF family protein
MTEHNILFQPPPLRYPRTKPSWLSSCLEVILPTECLVCHRPLRLERVCYRCRPSLPTLDDALVSRCNLCFEPLSLSAQGGSVCEACKLHHTPTDEIRFLWDYDGLARDLIRSMKYQPSLALAALCGTLLKDALPHFFARQRWDLIIPVPSSHLTYRRRLFHPCAELAHGIARQLKIPSRNILIHNRRRLPQASLNHNARLSRLRALFTIKPGASVEGKHILLVEDVITTGATIAAAAYQLKKAGAVRVDVLALARTRVWRRFRARVSAIFT